MGSALAKSSSSKQLEATMHLWLVEKRQQSPNFFYCERWIIWNITWSRHYRESTTSVSRLPSPKTCLYIQTCREIPPSKLIALGKQGRGPDKLWSLRKLRYTYSVAAKLPHLLVWRMYGTSILWIFSPIWLRTKHWRFFLSDCTNSIGNHQSFCTPPEKGSYAQGLSLSCQQW